MVASKDAADSALSNETLCARIRSFLKEKWPIKVHSNFETRITEVVSGQIRFLAVTRAVVVRFSKSQRFSE